MVTATLRRASLVLALSTACGETLPQYSEVVDLRVLAIRAEPPELLDDAAITDVRFDALVVDPRGGPVDVAWSFCPVASSHACHDFDDRLARAETSLRASFVALGSNAGEAAEWTATLTAPIERYRATAGSAPVTLPATPPRSSPHSRPVQSHVVRLAPFQATPIETCTGALTDLHAFHALTDLPSFVGGAWPSILLTARAGGMELEAMKRFVLSVQRPGRLLGCLEARAPELSPDLGLCDDAGSPTAGCLALGPRTANQNPRIIGVSFALSARGPFRRIDGPIPVQAGTSVWIRPELAPGSAEAFEALAIDPQDRAVVVDARTESIAVSWFATGGDLRHELTWPLYTRTLDNRYTAPENAPADGEPLVIWLVARDQRGGTDWREFEIVVP